MDAANSVVFDFEGSLDLARSLWNLADDVEQLLTSRVTLASTALSGWAGRFAEEFVERANSEQSAGAALAQALRVDAGGWATAWTAAMDEENRIRYAREVQRVKNDRSTLDKIGGFFGGHDDLPSMPNAAAVPQAPYFFPTRSFVRY